VLFYLLTSSSSRIDVSLAAATGEEEQQMDKIPSCQFFAFVAYLLLEFSTWNFAQLAGFSKYNR